MPLYLYLDTRNDKVYEIIQGMNDVHEAFAEDGYKLQRIFCTPQASIDTKIDPFSSQQFVERTGSKKFGNYGNVLDYGKEMSERRANKLGIPDPIKEKALDKYEKDRNGKHVHPIRKKQKLNEYLKKTKMFELE